MYSAGRRPRSNFSNRPQRQPRRQRSFTGQYIHPSKFINRDVKPPAHISYTPTHSFADFDFVDGLKRQIIDRGYLTPTPIQDQTIPAGLEGRDVLGLANTGSGKTAAFLLPIINKTFKDRSSRALIIAPTRELAQQIDEEFRLFSKGSGLTSVVCVGGMNIQQQIRGLKSRPEIIIGTPGRLKDLEERRMIRFDKINTLVLDEADRMLDMGFSVDINHIVSLLPKEKQSMCFSATITPEIEKLIHQILVDPVTVSVRTEQTSEHIYQDIVEYDPAENKFEVLHELISTVEFDKLLVFGETKRSVQKIADELSKTGYKAEAIHGNKTQSQRQRALKSFKDNKTNILVATDVAARGLDIPDVTHVINYDQPQTYDDYIHRIGRTGRAGKSGIALTFVRK